MRVIGLMSGTSVDGIDAALVELSGQREDLQADLIAAQTYPYPPSLRQKILQVCAGSPIALAELAELDDAIATCFATAAIAVNQGHPPAELIGSHGQTVFHRPPHPFEGAPFEGSPADPRDTRLDTSLGYSLQIGRGAVIAQQTGIDTVSNFRVADIAVGGQGAPLVPPVDAALLTHPLHDRCVQNLGGIGNVTYLPSAQSPQAIRGWDTGPGNVLIDLAVQHLSQGQLSYDRDGAWAASGKPALALLSDWLQHPFFQQVPPKSTGRECFGVDYLQQCLQSAQTHTLSDADLLATLTELTAVSIADSYQRFLPQWPQEVLLCGGGSRNAYLCDRIQAHLPQSQVLTTDAVGLNGDFKEAIAFAVLAYWRKLAIPGNLPEVTGARKPVLLGEILYVA